MTCKGGLIFAAIFRFQKLLIFCLLSQVSISIFGNVRAGFCLSSFATIESAKLTQADIVTTYQQLFESLGSDLTSAEFQQILNSGEPFKLPASLSLSSHSLEEALQNLSSLIEAKSRTDLPIKRSLLEYLEKRIILQRGNSQIQEADMKRARWVEKRIDFPQKSMSVITVGPKGDYLIAVDGSSQSTGLWYWSLANDKPINIFNPQTLKIPAGSVQARLSEDGETIFLSPNGTEIGRIRGGVQRSGDWATTHEYQKIFELPKDGTYFPSSFLMNPNGDALLVPYTKYIDHKEHFGYFLHDLSGKKRPKEFPIDERILSVGWVPHSDTLYYFTEHHYVERDKGRARKFQLTGKTIQAKHITKVMWGKGGVQNRHPNMTFNKLASAGLTPDGSNIVALVDTGIEQTLASGKNPQVYVWDRRTKEPLFGASEKPIGTFDFSREVPTSQNGKYIFGLNVGSVGGQNHLNLVAFDMQDSETPIKMMPLSGRTSGLDLVMSMDGTALAIKTSTKSDGSNFFITLYEVESLLEQLKLR